MVMTEKRFFKRLGKLPMSATNVITVQQGKRQEDFPIDSFIYMEKKLHVIRKLIMDRAANIANSMDKNPVVYRVKKQHIDNALSEFFYAKPKARKIRS